MGEPRRSARTNKGLHSGRDLLEVYYSNLDDPHISKKAKLDDDEDHLTLVEITTPAETVRCLPCGTTDANYDEETDEGGLMIECENCTTWQHAKCMGYDGKRRVPKVYLCNMCIKIEGRGPANSTNSSSLASSAKSAESSFSQNVKNTSASASSAKSPRKKVSSVALLKKLKISSAAQKTRDYAVKALLNVILKANPDMKDNDEWASTIEAAIFESLQSTDKKYIDKSRAIMALVKKPVVFNRLLNREITADQLTTLPVEDIDPDLKHYAEKVRQELIRRSVLVVEDDQSQRVRRTHKGEEIVESIVDEGVEQNLNIVPSNIVRENANEKDQSSRNTIYSGQSNTYQYQGDDYDDVTVNVEGQEKEADKSHSSEAADDSSDDDMDLILERKSRSPEQAPTRSVTTQPKTRYPSSISKMLWSGELELPEVGSASVEAEFLSCPDYKDPNDSTSLALHNKAMRICKDLIDKPKIFIQGRLDRARADPYVEKIKPSRDLFWVKLVGSRADENFEKLFSYFLTRSKVGVVSSKSPFVKDTYIYAFDGNAPLEFDLPANDQTGLFVLFVVKKGYLPAVKSILKNSVSLPQEKPSSVSLHSILSKLEDTGSSPIPQPRSGHLPPKPQSDNQPQRHCPPVRGMQTIQDMEGLPSGSGLTREQLSYFGDMMSQNGLANGGPQTLLNVLQRNSR